MRRLFLPRRLVVSLFCFSCVFHMAPIPFFFGRDDFGEVFFLCNNNYERERGKKKKRGVLTRRERPKLYIASVWFYKRRAFVYNLVPLLL